jgi:hypothetical protein
VAREHGQQGGFADARAREQAQALAGPAGGEQIQHPHAQLQAWPQPGAAGGWRSGDPDAPWFVAGWQGPAPVQRLAKRVDDPAEPAIRYRKTRAISGAPRLSQASVQQGAPAWPDPIRRLERHGAGDTAVEPYDFGADFGPSTPRERQAIADGEVRGETGDIDGETRHPVDVPGKCESGYEVKRS